MDLAGFCYVTSEPYFDRGRLVVDVEDDESGILRGQPIEDYVHFSRQYFEYSHALDAYDRAFATWARACAAAGVSLWSDESLRLPTDRARHDARTCFVAAGIDLSGDDPYYGQCRNATAESQPERAERLGIDLDILRQAEGM